MTPLQVKPHRFSSIQVLQIWKPQGQVQQNGCFFPQQLHEYDLGFRERFFAFAMF
ncbi:hypothetical protein ACFL4N_00090 [Thermodesulfobacteriota bacterium]